MTGDYTAATKCPDPCVMSRNGNTTETKTDIAKFISFRFKLFRFRFVSVFRIFFVSVFVSVNGINFFPLTDISVSVNVNHTEPSFKSQASKLQKYRHKTEFNAKWQFKVIQSHVY